MISPEKENFMIERNFKDINIKDFFQVMKRRFWIVILITLITTSIGYYFSNYNYTPLYQTSTRIIIDSDNNYMSTLMVMIKDPIIMEKVSEKLEVARSPERISSQIEIRRIDDSQVVMISVVDVNPTVAMDIANLTATTFKSEVGNILDFDGVQLLSEAKENTFPINESKNRMMILGFIFGLVTGVGLIFLLDSLDETVEKASHVEEILGVPVIGVISKIKLRKLQKKRKQQEVDLRSEQVGLNK